MAISPKVHIQYLLGLTKPNEPTETTTIASMIEYIAITTVGITPVVPDKIKPCFIDSFLIEQMRRFGLYTIKTNFTRPKANADMVKIISKYNDVVYFYLDRAPDPTTTRFFDVFVMDEEGSYVIDLTKLDDPSFLIQTHKRWNKYTEEAIAIQDASGTDDKLLKLAGSISELETLAVNGTKEILGAAGYIPTKDDALKTIEF